MSVRFVNWLIGSCGWVLVILVIIIIIISLTPVSLPLKQYRGGVLYDQGQHDRAPPQQCDDDKDQGEDSQW